MGAVYVRGVRDLGPYAIRAGQIITGVLLISNCQLRILMCHSVTAAKTFTVEVILKPATNNQFWPKRVDE